MAFQAPNDPLYVPNPGLSDDQQLTGPEAFVPKSEQEAAGGVVDDKATRPERRFEGRRLLLAAGLGIFVLVCCMYEFTAIQNPTSGLAGLIGAGGKVAPTVANLQNALAGTPAPTSALGSLGSVQPLGPTITAGEYCRMISDYTGSGFYLKSLAQIRVNGFSYANGGLLRVVDPAVGWMQAALIDCAFDIRSLEAIYYVSSTATITPTLTVRAVAPAVRVQTVIVQQTAVPVTPIIQYSTTTNGVWLDGNNCWHFDVQNVRAIYTNGNSPASGGSVLCSSISSFTVVVK